MFPLPTLRGSIQQALYPFVRLVTCLTNVSSFQNSMEQRSVACPPRYGFTLPMNSLLAMDKLGWLNFHVSAIGRFHNNLAITLGSTTYANLTLMSDSMTVVQKANLIYDQSVSLRQVAAINFSTYTPPTVGVIFPTLNFGFASPTVSGVELPFSQASNFLTSVGDSAFGPRYAFSWFNPTAPLTHFPSTYLRTWKLTYPLLTTADVSTLENYFLGMQGRYSTFYFPDPTSVAVLTSGVSTGGSLPVSDSTTMQDGGYVMVDAEVMGVTTGSGHPGSTTLTVTRGQLGTSNVAHAANANVYVVYPNVRFAADDFPIRYLTLNQNAAEINLIQVFA